MHEMIDNTEFYYGVVYSYDKLTGFGFITENGSKQKVFVHATGLNQQVKKGDKVRYKKDAARENCAFHVELI